MLLEEENRKQKQLCDFLFEISESAIPDDGLMGYADRLKDIYSNRFRHKYATFYPVIKEIEDGRTKYEPDSFIQYACWEQATGKG